MSDRFKQRPVYFDKNSTGSISVSQLMELISGHPYEEQIKKSFSTDKIIKERIIVENIDKMYSRLKSIKQNYRCYALRAYSKDVVFSRGSKKVDGIGNVNPLIFNFTEYVDGDGELLKNFKAYAIYDSKSRYFEDFSMSKYANMLFDNSLDELAELNLNYFRNLSSVSDDFNKHQSYRMVEHNGEHFVRGITSLLYKEYGVDFSFVTAMLMLHKHMKENMGNNYCITYAALNESKLEMIITSDKAKKAGDFGMVRSAISVKTNDLGAGALTFTNIIRLDVKGNGIYLYPTSKDVAKKDISINHGRTNAKTALDELNKAEDFYGFIDYFIKELSEIKSIKTPDELRKRVLVKITNPNSSLKSVGSDLTNLFKNPLKDIVTDFAKFLEMCRKAEELDIDYDLKDKLRVIISEVLLSGRK